MDRYAVLGHPISHSKSPAMHQGFALSTQQTLSYEAIDIVPENFVQELQALVTQGYLGFNVTVPFKEQAKQWVSELTPRAQRAGAVNTLIRQSDNRWLGDNTDGAGMVLDMQQNLGWTLAGKKVQIIGAGGAVRGVVQPLLDAGVASICIANRTPAKAEALVAEFDDARLGACSLQGIKPGAELVINGTSTGLSGALPDCEPEVLFTSAHYSYDMMYAATDTAFQAWSRQHRVAECADGLGMLVAQGALAFEAWRGVLPDLKSALNSLRLSLK